MAERDRGSALVMAVFVLALLTGLGIALLSLSQSTVRQTQAGLRAKKAFYMAESGIEHGRIELYNAADGSFDDDLIEAAGLDGAIDLDLDALTLTWNSSGEVTGILGVNDDKPVRALTKIAFLGRPGWYATYLTNDPIDGPTNLTDTNSRLMLTSIGGSENNGTEIVQAIIEPFEYIPPVPPAAITMLGPLPSFDNGSSAAQSHTGSDCGVSGAPYAPIVGTVDSNARAQIQTDMQRPDTFSSGGFVGTDTIADLNDPIDPIVSAAGNGTLDPFWNDCAGLKELVEFMSLAATYYCNTDHQVCAVPATNNASITVIDGDLTQTPPGPNYGTLVVTGRLEYNGNTGWDGVILVVGEGYILRSGGGTGNPSGSLIIANVDPTPDGPRADKSDWCTTGDNGFLRSQYETSGAGTSTVEWCTSKIAAANDVRTYRVVQFLQR